MKLKYLNKKFENHDEMEAFLIKEYAIKLKNGDDVTDLKVTLDKLNTFKKKKRENDLLDYWKNLDVKFINAWDVPRLPKEDYYDEIVVPTLIRCGAIPKNELIDGHFYYGNYRNSNFGKWVEKDYKFEINRKKFDQFYTDRCNHFEDDNNFALFVPIREVTEEEFNNTKNK